MTTTNSTRLNKAEAHSLAVRINADARAAGVGVRTEVERGWRAYSVIVSAVDPKTGRWSADANCGLDVHLASIDTAEAYTPERLASFVRLAQMSVAERKAYFAETYGAENER